MNSASAPLRPPPSTSLHSTSPDDEHCPPTRAASPASGSGHRRRLRRLPAVGRVRPARRRRADQRDRLGGHEAQGRSAPAGRNRARSAGARRPNGRANQVVIRLDNAVTRANYESTRQRYLGLRAMEGRLLAEQLGLAGDHLSPGLCSRPRSRPADPAAHHRAEPAAAVAARVAGREPRRDRRVDPRTAGADRGLSRRAGRPQQPADLFEREVKGVRDLVAEGYAPLNKQMELERAMADSLRVDRRPAGEHGARTERRSSNCGSVRRCCAPTTARRSTPDGRRAARRSDGGRKIQGRSPTTWRAPKSGAGDRPSGRARRPDRRRRGTGGPETHGHRPAGRGAGARSAAFLRT